MYVRTYLLITLIVAFLSVLADKVEARNVVENTMSFHDEPVSSTLSDESPFDTLYAVFRRLSATFRGLDETRQPNPSQTVKRGFGFAVENDGGIGRIITDGWTLDFGQNPRKYHRSWTPYDRYDEFDERRRRDSVEAILVPVVEAVIRRPGYSARAEKERMVCQLEAFGDTASAFPVVYGLIAMQYGGDARAYVDALFDGSVMTSRKRLKRLVRSPILKRLRDDMGFQFAVSKLMFCLWEQQGRPADPVVDGTRLVIFREELQQIAKY